MDHIINKYSEIGQHAYNPRMMVALLFYGYSTGIRSSRKIADACKDRLDFMYITKGLTPTHDRISDFRKDNLEELKDLFKKIVLIGAAIGLIHMGDIKVSIDGTKIRANASAKQTKDEDGLNKLIVEVEKEINELFKEAERMDEGEREDENDKIMKKIQSKKRRKEAIEKALKMLEEQKKKVKEDIVKEKEREPTEVEEKKMKEMKINVTDKDAKYMKERSGVIKPNYNGQISVDEREQFIVAN